MAARGILPNRNMLFNADRRHRQILIDKLFQLHLIDGKSFFCRLGGDLKDSL